VFTIHKDDVRYTKAVECINNEDYDALLEAIDVAKIFNKDGLELINGIIHIDGTPMPDSLSERIIKFQKAGLPFTALVKFWKNLQENPSYNSRKMLFDFLQHNEHPLTSDGCFIAYRGCTEDFKDRHTGTFDNSPGSICEMPRSEVDENPNNTCSAGLHVARHSYAYNWSDKTVAVKVNPKDVVCVPVDYNGSKMRVCKFEVLAICEKPSTEELYQIETKECGSDCSECKCESKESECSDCDLPLEDCVCDEVCYECGFIDCICDDSY